MLRIRLRRVGKKKKPMYRIVVADSRAPRDGAFVENLGYYHPLDNPTTIVIDEERAKHWLDKGAIPSDRVSKILKIQGIAELPAKLATRIALGDERAKAASNAKAEAAKETATEEPKAEAAKETAAEEPKAEATKETAAEEPKAEAAKETAAEEPEAAKETATEEPKAEAAKEDAAGKGEERSE